MPKRVPRDALPACDGTHRIGTESRIDVTLQIPRSVHPPEPAAGRKGADYCRMSRVAALPFQYSPPQRKIADTQPRAPFDYKSRSYRLGADGVRHACRF